MKIIRYVEATDHYRLGILVNKAIDEEFSPVGVPLVLNGALIQMMEQDDPWWDCCVHGVYCPDDENPRQSLCSECDGIGEDQ